MKNQYVADVNDYRKYGLLRILSGEGAIRTGVCWMLTPEDGRTDGKFVDYLRSPGRFRDYDPDLFEALAECIRVGARDVRWIEDAGVLPGAVFHSELLADARPERKRYFEEARRRFAGVEMVFFDPDNGMEIRSRPYGRKHSSKFLFWPELVDTYAAGSSVLVYQHFIREQRDAFIARMATEMKRRTGAPAVHAFRTPNVLFLLVARPEHAAHFADAAARVADRWKGQITVSHH